jgi:hypothetical protein
MLQHWHLEKLIPLGITLHAEPVDPVQHARIKVGILQQRTRLWRQPDVCVQVHHPGILIEPGQAFIDPSSFAKLVPTGIQGIGLDAFHVMELAYPLGITVLRGSDHNDAVKDVFVSRKRTAKKI